MLVELLSERTFAERAGVRKRYIASMRQYCTGALAQVRQTYLPQAPSIEDVLNQRRQSVCVASLFALVEFGHKIGLPDHVFETDLLLKVQSLGIDITLLHNDLLSYYKEEAEEVPHNIIAACRRRGMGAQEAFTFVGEEVERRLQDLNKLTVEIAEGYGPSHGELMRYVQGIKDVIKANLFWSFKSDRFLSGEQKSQLAREGTLEVLETPRYMSWCNSRF